MLNSAEHEICPANKYDNANNSLFFLYLLVQKFPRPPMNKKKEFAIVSNLRLITKTFHAQLT